MNEGYTYIKAVSGDGEKPVEKHEQAISSFERHREMYEQYAGYSIAVKPAPEGLDTFAFDLETNTIYLNDKFYALLGYPEEGTSFATFHEIEHFREKLALLKEKDGAYVFGQYLEKLDTKASPHAGAYGVMDNCISDIRQNGAVVARTHVGFDAIEKQLYRDVQFPDVDFMKEGNNKPLHIQLPYAILNEYRSGRVCVVDERARKVIDELQHTTLPNGKVVDLLALMTNPDPKVVSMSKRLLIQDTYVWPRMLELLEEDLKEAQKKKEKDDEGEGKKGGEENKGGKGQESKNNTSPQNGVVQPQENPSPNEVFREAYAEAGKRVPNATPVDAQKEALKKWVQENGSEEDRVNKALAERLGVKKEEVKAYKDIARSLNAPNPETQESVIDDLEKVIRRIISRRLKEKHKPRYPVEEGDELVDPAGWLAEVRGGNFEPKVWEDTEIKLEKSKKCGDVEITLVCDRSGSMKGEKQREQQKALVLFMEALKRFNDVLDDEESRVEKPLTIQSEIYTFQADSTDGVPIKKMGKVLTEKERIVSSAKVATTSGGSTTDFISLEAITKSIVPETVEKIKEGELRKIVIVFTDGDSDDSSRVRTVCTALRKQGVVVIGVGITEAGKSALTTYAPKAVLAERAEDLPKVLADILKEVLADV
ncbi:MAG: VWA domain-containing protein [Candidatus Kaiserbacteria bacterium]|nr:VWA domain-containing protein [Candidatus Kaiserbacteria bacterium]